MPWLWSNPWPMTSCFNNTTQYIKCEILQKKQQPKTTHILYNWTSKGALVHYKIWDLHCIPAVHKWSLLPTRQLACLCVFNYIKIIAFSTLWIIHCCCTAVSLGSFGRTVTHGDTSRTVCHIYFLPRLVHVRAGGQWVSNLCPVDLSSDGFWSLWRTQLMVDDICYWLLVYHLVN